MEQFVDDAIRTEPQSYEAAMARLQNLKTIRLLHVAMGLVTEAGEIMGQLKKHIVYGEPLNDVRLISDLGDSSWYERVGCRVLDVKLDEMLTRNVRELKVRFPDKFSEQNALVRDEGKEMQAALGQHVERPVDPAIEAVTGKGPVKVLRGLDAEKMFRKEAPGGVTGEEDKNK